MSPQKKTKKKKRTAQTRPYPKATLENVIKISMSIKDNNGGNPWNTENVAGAVNLSKKGMPFYYLAAGSRDFGFTEGSRETKVISITDFGKELIYAPNAESLSSVKKKAFLKIKLFKDVYEYYKGNNLPELEYLSNTLTVTFGLDESYHEEFANVFKANCNYLGNDIQQIKTETGNNNHHTQSIITLVDSQIGNEPLCFVIMPFSEKKKDTPKNFFNEVLNSLIAPAGRNAGFKVQTADRKGSDVIQATIINNILNADLVVADLTEHNPNVLFELGMRMMKDKPVALIRSKDTESIFDVDNMLRVFEYNPNLWLSTISVDLPLLSEHIKATWENKDSLQTYMKILTGN